MVLEAILLCLDNSDWTRNGDYFPNRWETQVNAANFIIENRCEQNPENGVGIMSMAGKRVEIHSTLTNDISRLFNAMKDIRLSGECDLITALNISILTLKHRINKNQKQKVILFVGSPLTCTCEALINVGKKLKKYNISIDIISFGHIEENKENLTKLLNTVNNSNNSSILEVPVGEYIMDSLFNSNIISQNFGQEQVPQGNSNINQEGVGMSQFERDLNMAMEMSRRDLQKEKANNEVPKQKVEEVNEEEELEKAKKLSLVENEEEDLKRKEEKEKKITNEAFENPEFIKDLLNDVSDSNVKEEDVKDIMKQLKQDKEKNEEKKQEKKEEKERNNEEEKKEEKKSNDQKERDKMDIDKENIN